MSSNTKWIIGMVAAVLVAVAGQAHTLPEPWDHVFSLGGVIGTALSGYMMQRPDPKG